jgi:hypothetical protein
MVFEMRTGFYSCRFSRGNLFLALLWIAALPACVWAQASIPSIFYTQDFPGSDPQHYAITIHADGSGSYQSDGRLTSQGASGEMSSLSFSISPESCKRIFTLAKKAHYFEGPIDSDNPKIANTGKKVLGYTDGEKTTTSRYNFSSKPAVQQLTSFFQGLSATLEFGRRLTFEHRYEKLALADEMRDLMQQSKSGQTVEIEAIAPVLQKIVDDHSVMTFVRAQAQMLLRDAKTASLKK